VRVRVPHAGPAKAVDTRAPCGDLELLVRTPALHDRLYDRVAASII
jgi:hypothetical protein